MVGQAIAASLAVRVFGGGGDLWLASGPEGEHGARSRVTDLAVFGNRVVALRGEIVDV